MNSAFHRHRLHTIENCIKIKFQNQKKKKIIIIILGGAGQTGCYREGQCCAGPGVSPQRTPHTG